MSKYNEKSALEIISDNFYQLVDGVKYCFNESMLLHLNPDGNSPTDKNTWLFEKRNDTLLINKDEEEVLAIKFNEFNRVGEALELIMFIIKGLRSPELATVIAISLHHEGFDNPLP